MYSTDANWHFSHPFLSKGELLLSGLDQGLGVGWSHKSGLLHQCFPPNSQKRKAALQASVTACSFTTTNKALGPNPTAIPASTQPDRDYENSPAPHQFCKMQGDG